MAWQDHADQEADQVGPVTQKKLWFLKYEADGRPSLNWRLLLPIQFFCLVIFCGSATCVSVFAKSGFPLRPTAFGVIGLPMVGTWWLLFYQFYQRELSVYRGETPRLKFSITALIVLTSLIGVWLGLIRIETSLNSQKFLARDAFVEQLMSVVVDGTARYSGGTNELMVVVERQDFADDDFRQLVSLLSESPDNAYIYYLTLSNTQVTDDAIELMADWQGLQYLHLDGTNVTGKSLERLGKLKRLLSVGLADTEVGDAAIRSLQKRRPKLTVSPYVAE